MTVETKTTIELSDIVAVEFECRKCGTKVIRNIEVNVTPGVVCPTCGEQWVIGNSQEHGALAHFLRHIATYAAAKNEPYVMRFEIKAAIDGRKD